MYRVFEILQVVKLTEITLKSMQIPLSTHNTKFESLCILLRSLRVQEHRNVCIIFLPYRISYSIIIAYYNSYL